MLLIHPKLDGYHNASKYMCRGVVLSGPPEVPWEIYQHHSASHQASETTEVQPIVWRANFLADIIAALVSWKKSLSQSTTATYIWQEVCYITPAWRNVLTSGIGPTFTG